MIVCGTDLSESSLDALVAAIAIATRRGDRDVILVHALDAGAADDDDARTVLLNAASKRLAIEAERAAAGTTIRVRAEVIVGPPVEAMVAVAETEGATLMVIASKGETNAPAMGLGGTAVALVQAAPIPLLVVRSSEAFAAWAASDRPLRTLVAVDDSASCDAAIRFAKALRTAGPADLIVGHVYFPDEAGARYGIEVEHIVDADPEIERLLTRDLARRFGAVDGAGTLAIRPTRGLGRIGDHLLELAAAERVDVIVMGTRQKAGLGRLSSVSTVILHDAPQSVLCIPAVAGAMDDVPRLKIAVVATDLSDFANRAVPYAYSIAGADGEVHIVHVIDDADADVPALTSALNALAPRGLATRTIAHVVHGNDPAEAIGETAERVGADVVCIASHGRTGISRALMGSVADKLLKACSRPVLVLRPPTE
jgi:nucleotide-binding universal stress UspA family protein